MHGVVTNLKKIHNLHRHDKITFDTRNIPVDMLKGMYTRTWEAYC